MTSDSGNNVTKACLTKHSVLFIRDIVYTKEIGRVLLRVLRWAGAVNSSRNLKGAKNWQIF